jgi:lysozyme
VKTELARQLRGDEGEKPCVYGAGLRPDEITYLLNNDIDDRIEQLTRRLPWFQDLDDARRGVLLNMAFQMGVAGLLAFKNTLALIEERKYENAAHALLQSKWATQTPVRAKRMAEQMRTGRWQYADGA